MQSLRDAAYALPVLLAMAAGYALQQGASWAQVLLGLVAVALVAGAAYLTIRRSGG